jgi:hypothetical protein
MGDGCMVREEERGQAALSTGRLLTFVHLGRDWLPSQASWI